MNTRMLPFVAGAVCLWGLAALAQEPLPAALAQKPEPAAETLKSQSKTAIPVSPLRASQLLQAPVQTAKGEAVGQLKEITIDRQSGNVQFAVIALAQPSDAPALPTRPIQPKPPGAIETPIPLSTPQLVPVPWNRIAVAERPARDGGSEPAERQGDAQSVVVLQVELATLKRAPFFDARTWSRLDEPEFIQRVFAHYSTQSDIGSFPPGEIGSDRGRSPPALPQQPK